MRRIVLIATGVIVLVAAGTAYAALNTYTANFSFASKKAGTPAKPVPMGFTQQLTATGINGNRTAVLLDLKTTTYGLKADLKDFPTCTGRQDRRRQERQRLPQGRAGRQRLHPRCRRS